MRSTDKPLLGGISPAQFMRRHWQKSPRLMREAVPGFNGVVDRKGLFALAARDDVESRLVIRTRGKRGWTLEHGPFRAADFKALPASNWTLLVQGVDLHVDAGAALLRKFSFIPFARLDDLMMSYAVPGGGVGPHFDSYDVFLLQASGRRRWQISQQDDLRIQPGMPLKILSHFKPTDSWDLDPGDMLYLPPSIAHDGVALTECITCSIGFRAPTTRELADAFLQFLPEKVELSDDRYADPDLAATKTPGRIGESMQRRLGASLRGIRWGPETIAEFTGCMLSEPKPGVYFERPEPPMSLARFVRAAQTSGRYRLDRRTRMLYDKTNVYVNGEVFAAVAEHPALPTLADERTLQAADSLPAATIELLYQVYLHGALHVGKSGDS